MARVAVVGVGAIGGVVASLLVRAGHSVILCTRRPLASLTVETAEGEVAVRADHLTDPKMAPAVDWVMVATKAYDAATAAAWFGGLCASGAPVAILQNGVEHRERFAPYIASEKIVPVIVDCPVERISPERMRQRGAMRLVVQDDAQGVDFVGLFSGTGTDAVAVDDLRTAAWRKLCNNAVGVLPTLLLQPSGCLHDEGLGLVALDLVRECIAVGRAEGAKLDDSLAEAMLAIYRRAPADSLNSMHADRIAGRAMEIDARNGAIVRKGEQHGIPTPANRMAVALLQAMTRPS
jgi:2-dehydropantoate 2-reductase